MHTFRRVEDQLRRTGSLTRQRCTIRTDQEKETSVLLSFIENKRTSIRIACNLEARNLEVLGRPENTHELSGRPNIKKLVHTVLKKYKPYSNRFVIPRNILCCSQLLK